MFPQHLAGLGSNLCMVWNLEMINDVSCASMRFLSAYLFESSWLCRLLRVLHADHMLCTRFEPLTVGMQASLNPLRHLTFLMIWWQLYFAFFLYYFRLSEFHLRFAVVHQPPCLSLVHTHPHRNVHLPTPTLCTS